MSSLSTLILTCGLVVALSACGQATPAPDTRTDTAPAESAAPTTPSAEPTVAATLPAAVADALREMYADSGDDIYTFQAMADLDGDGADEVIVHVVSPMLCGTGGCNTLVFTPRETGYELVGDITVTRPPIRVSSASTNGWSDLIVHISGGGLEGAFDVAITFDGAEYQRNPTAPMAEPATDLDNAAIVIPEFETLTDGTPLWTE